MEVMFSSLCCKFIIGQLFEIVNTFLKKNIKKYLNKQKEKKSLKIDRGKHKVMTALRRFIVISVLWSGYHTFPAVMRSFISYMYYKDPNLG